MTVLISIDFMKKCMNKLNLYYFKEYFLADYHTYM